MKSFGPKKIYESDHVRYFLKTKDSEGVSYSNPMYVAGELLGYNLSIDTLYIKSSLDGIPVRGIRKDILKGNCVKNLVIGENIRWFSMGCFSGYDSLETITFEKNSRLRQLGNGTFVGCKKLKKINLSECSKLTEIGSEVFRDCSCLEEVYLPTNVVLIATGAFVNTSSLKDINLENILFFGEYSFAWTSLEKLAISRKNRTTISKNAFKGALLKDVYLSGEVNVLKESFSYLSNLTKVTLDYGERSKLKIDENSFEGSALNAKFHVINKGRREYKHPLKFNHTKSKDNEFWNESYWYKDINLGSICETLSILE